MKKVHWGIISTAEIGYTQLIPAMTRSKNAVIEAIASKNEKVKDIAQKFNIPKIYEGYQDLLNDPTIDAVYIPLPNHMHKEWAIKAAEAKKHILCEKPAALNALEVEEIKAACEENQVKFMEAFMYQFHPQHKRVQEIISSGELGEIKLMKANFSFFMEHPEGNIRMDPQKGGGAIYDIGSYCVHAIRTVLQSEPLLVRAYSELDPEYKVDMLSLVHMKMENGVNAIFDCSFDMSFRQEYEVIGTKGTLRVPRAYRPDTEGGEGVIEVHKPGELRTERIIADQYKLQVEHFSDSVLTMGEPFYSIEQTIQNMRVIDACYQSIKLKTDIHL